MPLEYIDDVFRGLVNRENSAVRSSVNLESTVFEEWDNVSTWKSIDAGSDKSRLVRSKRRQHIFDRPVMANVALSATGYQDFSSDPRSLFQQDH